MKKLLVDASYIRNNLGYSMSTIKTANKFHGFPCPVLKIANRYQWRLSDIEKWVDRLPAAFDVHGRPLKGQNVTFGSFISNERASK